MTSIKVWLAAAGMVAIVTATSSAQTSSRPLQAGGSEPAAREHESRSKKPLVVNGDMWLRSTADHRKAFLVGAANMLALESAYAKHMGTTPPPAGARAAKALDGMTLDQVSSRVTRWYEANPGRRTMPVIGVIWLDMVKADSLAR